MRNLKRGFLFLTAMMGLTLGLASKVSQSQNNFGAEGQEPRTKQAVEFGNRANEILGKHVYCARGDRLGRISDLVIDRRTGALKYVVISSGGFAGIGGQRRAVPPGAISLATIRRNAASLNVTPARWRNAPKLGGQALENLGDPAEAQRIYQYYHQAWPSTAGPERESGPKGIDPGKTHSLQFASDLIGDRVENRQGRVVGRVLDLFVELKKPKPTFAILKPAALPASAEELPADQLYLVAANDLQRTGGHSVIAPEVTPVQFQRAQVLEADSWTMPAEVEGDARVYRYPRNDLSMASRVAADNTGRNVRDRKPGALTPIKQSESAEDLDLARSIRQAVVKHGNFSLSAKNVKVITGSGKVVLRGPVRSAKEKSEIGQLAEQAAGVQNVENNLEIARK